MSLRSLYTFLLFTVIKVFRVRGVIVGIVGSLLGITRNLVDDAFNKILNNTLRNLLSERRLAHLIRLGHGTGFYDFLYLILLEILHNDSAVVYE